MSLMRYLKIAAALAGTGFLIYMLVVAAQWRSDKQEWAAIQWVEDKNRGLDIPDFTVVERFGCRLLKVSSNSSPKYNIWILLNPESHHRYKQMPRGNYHVDSKRLGEFVSMNTMDPDVRRVIGSHEGE